MWNKIAIAAGAGAVLIGGGAAAVATAARRYIGQRNVRQPEREPECIGQHAGEGGTA